MIEAAAQPLAPTLDAIRLFLHVAGATVWVGGMFVMMGLQPTARTHGPEAPKSLARAFSRLAWPAFALLIITGFWNLAAGNLSDQSNTWQAVFGVKMVMVILTGVGTFLHQRATTKAGLAIWGSVAGLAAVVALFLGILIAG